MKYKPECESDYGSSDVITVVSTAINTFEIEPKNTTLQIGDTKVGLLIESENFCILNESLATELLKTSPLSRWLTTAPAKGLKIFDNEPIPMFGMLQTTVKSNCWRIKDAEFIVIKDGLKPLIRRKLFDAVSISII